MSWKRLSPYLPIGGVVAATLLVSQCKVDKLIGPPNGGVLTLSPLSVSDSAPLGSTGARSERLIVGNGATGRITWTATTAHGSAWLHLAAATGTAPDTLPLTLIPSGLALGTYRDTVVVTGSGSSEGELRVPVQFTVQPCTVTPTTVGSQVPGTLGAASCGAPHRSDHPAALYSFSGSIGDSVSIELTAPAGYLVFDSTTTLSKPSFAESGTCGGVGGNPCLYYQRLPRTGSYVVEVTTNTATDSGAYTLTLSPPRAPAAPTTLTQWQSDSQAVVATGDTVFQNTMVFSGVVSDPDRPDSLRLEVEVKRKSVPFTGTNTTLGTAVKNGQVAYVRVVGLADDSSYHWRARGVDQTVRQGPWLSYGGNPDSAADFVLGNSLALPGALGQFKSDNVTALAVGATNVTRTLIFKSLVTDPAQGEFVRLEVEYQPVGTAFTNVAKVSSPLSPPGDTVTATSAALTDNASYHWQAREVSQSGRTSGWASFGGNAESAPDFKEALTPQQLVFVASPTVDTAGAPIHPTVQVAARDSLGNTLASFHDSITVTIDSNPGGATLSGTAKVAAVAGVATFPGLSLDKTGVGYRLRATLASPALTVQSGLFNVSSGAISSSLSTVAAAPATIHASKGDSISTITVTVRDPLGNPVPNVTVVLSDTATGDSLRQPAATTNAFGVTTGSVSARLVGVKTITATAGAQAITQVATVTVLPAHAQNLTFTVQPTSTSAGATITPAVQITARDSLGNVDTSYAGNVTVAIGTNPGGATLSGTATVAAAHGVATFGNLSLNKTGTGYTLTASGVSVAVGATSTSFNIGAGTGTKLAFTVEPSSAVAGTAIAPAIEVTAQDAGNNTVTTFTGTVTLTLAANPGSDTLGGTVSVAAVGGKATFSSVVLHHVGAGYTLSAGATGFTAATSTTFNVRPGAATKLAFTTEPTGSSAGATLPATVVTAQDAFGNTDTSYAAVVTASIDSNPSGGVLGGTKGVAAAHGVTTFSTLTIDKAGVGYRLAATATGLTQARSTPFNVTAGAVSAVKSTVVALPATLTAGGTGSTISVTARDSLGNPVAGAAVVIASTGTGNTITQPAGVTDSTGLATGSFASTKAESKTVSVTVGGVLLNQTATVTVNPALISASHSSLGAAPASIAAGGGISVITATARDAFDNPIAGLTVTLAATGSGNTLTDPPSPSDASGVASGALSSTVSGAKIVSATIGGTAVTQTDTVTVTSGGPTHLVFSVEPATATAGVALAPTVQVSALDANNNVSTAFTGSVTLAIGTNPGGGTLIGTTSTSATAGVATFPGIRIDPVGTGYTLTASAGGLAGATSTAFNIVAGPASKLGVASQPSGAAVSGVAFAQQPAIQIQDSVGNQVSQSGTTITAAIGTGTGTLGGTLTALTGAGGQAAFTDLKITGLVGSRTLTFTAGGLTGVSSGAVVVSAGAATQIAVSGGNHQAATAGAAVGTPPSVLVTDQSGNPVSGTSVTFALPGSAGANGSLTGPTQSTNASGIATVGSWTLGTTAKPDSMTATSTGLTGSPLTFVDTAKVGAPANIAKFSGDNLVGPVATRLATPHDALVTDANGNPVPGVAVAWAAVGGGSVDSATSHTDANGHAVMNRTLGSTPGGESTTATVASITPVSFSVTAQVGGATQMALNGGDQQKDTVGQTLPVPLSVLVKDALNNPVPGVAISWSVINGGGTVDSATSHTNGSGIATTHWILGTAMSPVDSTQLVQATGVGSPVTFTAFTVPDAVSASQTSVTASSPITASSGSSQSTITVTARDQYGNVIKGKTVTLAATGTGNTVTNPATATNVNGVATGTLSSTVSESKTVTATVGGVAIAQQPSIVVNPAAAASLNYAQQPTNVVAGASITPAITVEILDAFSNLVTAASNPVSLALASNPGAATLSGSVTNVAAVSGVATFANASPNKIGTGYTLAASSAGLSGQTSGGFNVSSGAVSAAQSSVAAASPITAGGAASTVTVTARDANGNPIAGATVVLAATGSGNTLTQPGGVTDAGGVATGSLASTVAESKTVSAKITGVDITQTPVVVVDPGAAQNIALNGGGAQSATVATAVIIAPSVIVKDVNNNPVPGVAVTFAVTAGGGAVVPTTPVFTNAAGVAAVTSWTLGNTTGTNTLTATATGLSGSPVTVTATGTPGAATHFAFSQEPTSAVAGASITPAIVVSALDAHNNVDPTFTGGITLSIANNAGGGSLTGTTTVAAVQGVSQFTDISIDKAGNGYTLTASNTGPTPATSAAFNITPGTATHLSFTQQPTSAASGASIAPAVTVTALDAHDNIVTTFANPITLSIANNAGGGTLSGGTGGVLANGVATFSGLSIDKVGTGYTLSASATGVTGSTSSGFNITPGAATKLAFTVQPSSAAAGASLAPAVQITAQDAAGNTATGFNGSVSVAIGNNPGGSTLNGTTAIIATAGMANFSDLSLTRTGSGYTLTASATSLTGATSNGFDITPAAASVLVFTTQPVSDTAAGSLGTVQVTARDAFGNTATGFANQVTVAIANNPGGGTLSGTSGVTPVLGVASFPGLSINKSGAAYTLSAAATGVTGVTSTGFNITPGNATHLAFTGQPTDVKAGAAISPVVAVTALDANNNVATTPGTDTIRIGTNPGGSVLSGDTAVARVSGASSHVGLSLNKVGTGYTLTARSGTLTPATSTTFNVTAGDVSAAQTTVGATSPITAGGAGSTVTVTARDANGNPVAGASVALVVSGSGNTITQPGLTDATGVATGSFTSTVAESKTVSATVNSVAITQTATVVVQAGAVSAAQSTVSATSPITASSGASQSTITVTARDASGNPIAGAAVLLAASGTGNTVTQPVGTTNASGVATGTLSSTVAESKTVSATINAVGVTQTATVVVTPAAAANLNFLVQPSSATATATIAPAMQVEVRDAFNNRVTAATNPVTLAIGTNAGGGTLSGTVTGVAPVNGIATFSDASINKSGTGYTLSATSSGLTTATSATFNITAGSVSASQSTVTATSPITASSGASQSTITVTARDASGNPVPSASVSVTIGGTGNTTGALTGATNLSGVFTTTLSSTVAESKLVSATANSVGITQTASVVVNPAAASQLAFTGQPVSDTSAGPLGGVQVTAKDPFGNVATGFAGTDTVSFTNNAGGGTLSGTVIVVAAAGVANFPGLSIDKTGTGYTLGAKSGSTVTAATSSPFNVTPGNATHLTFTVQPSSATAGATIAPAVVVAVQDGRNNTVTGFAGSDTIRFSTNPSGAALAGDSIEAFTAGVATHASLNVNKTGTGYVFSARSGTPTAATSSAFNITAGSVSPSQTTVTATSPITAGGPGSTITVTARDALGNPVAGATVVLVISGTGNTFTQPGVTDASGTTTTTLTSTVAESKTVSATVNSVGITQQATILVNPGAPSASQSTVAASSPITASSGSSQSTITVTAKDANGNLIVGATVVLAATGTGNTLTQPSGGVSGAGGVATGTLSSTVAESKTVSATIGGVGITQTATVVVNPGAPNNLNYVVQPSNAASGAAIAPAIQVEIRDALNNRVTTAANQVSLAILTNPGSGTLSGTVTNVSPVNGVATFSNASIDKAGNGYQLSATATSLASATSSTFNITAGTVSAAQSTVAATSPISTDAGSSTITVTAKDAAGNPIQGATVALAASGTGNTLTQPVGTTNASGVATGTLSSTVAESKTVSATINSVGITQTATVLVNSGAVSAAQSTVAATSPITASTGASQSTITVTAKDAAGNPVAGAAVVLAATGSGNTLTQPIGNTNSSGVATGTLSSTVAELKTVSATISGVGITQTATVQVNPGTPANLNYVVQPSNAVSGTSIAPAVQVEIRDALNNRVTTASNQVSLAILNNAGGGTLSGTVANVSPVSGVATFSNASIDKAGTGYTLSATASGLTSATSSAFNITAGSATTIAAASTPPAAATVGSSVTAPSVLVTDAHGNPVSGTGVTFTVTAGNGSIVPASPASLTTDGTGHASLTTWTLGTTAGTNTVSAASTGLTGTPVIFSVSGTAGTVSASQSTVAATSPITASSGGSQSTITVTAKDGAGNPISGATVVLAASGSGNTLTQPVGTTDGSGVATGTLSSTVAESKTVSATINAVGVTQTATVQVNPGTPANVNYVVQPSSATAATSIAPAIQVEIRDALNNRVTSASNQVSLAILTNAGGGTLSGTVANVSPVSGVATFNNASIDKAGTGYTLTATASGLTSATSSAFNITAGTATHLAFTQQPTSATSGASIAPAITVTALDASNNVVTTFANQVSLAIANNAGGGTLTGGAAVTPVSGVATFSGVSIDKSGTGYTLSAAASGVTGVTSSAFNITAGNATHLVFSQQPTSAVSGASIAPAITVTALDANNNVATAFANQIALAIANNAGGGTLTGGGAVSPVSGVATFSGVSIDKAGTGYTLSAAASGVTGATSSAFNITAGTATHLAFTQQPTSATSGASIAPAITVTALDASNNVATTFANQVSLAIANNAGGGTLTGGAATTPVSGVATFSGVSIDKAGTGYTLSAAASGVTGATSSAFNITAGTATHLAFSQQPTSATSGASIAPAITVTALDASNNVATTFANQVSLAIANNAGGGTLTGGGAVTPVSGVASFAAASIDKAGTGYTLSAAASGVTGATSSAFNITAGTVSASQSTVSASSPITASSGSSQSTITVTAKDANGNVISGATVILAASGSNNTLGQPGATNGSGVTTGTLSSTTAETKTVSATINGVAITQTASVEVDAGAATQLVFTSQPTNAVQGQAFNPVVVVTAEDAFGNTDLNFTGSVQMTIATDPGVASSLNGTNPVTAVAGVATFNGLNITTLSGGIGYQLGASSGALTATSAAFNITLL